MGYDVMKRKCGAHNHIIGNRETCPQCASDLRAKMGPKPAPCGDDRDVQWDAGGGPLKRPYEDKFVIDDAGKLSWSKCATMDIGAADKTVWQMSREELRELASKSKYAKFRP